VPYNLDRSRHRGVVEKVELLKIKTKLERTYDVDPKRRKIVDARLMYTLAYLLTEGWIICSQTDSDRIEFVSF
jgi:hypothetical protein